MRADDDAANRTLADPVDDSGNPVTGVNVTWDAKFFNGSTGNTGTDELGMLLTNWDIDARGGEQDWVISVTGLTGFYSTYDVIVYTSISSNTAQNRGGNVTANGGDAKSTRNIRLTTDALFGGVDGFYVESNTGLVTTAFDADFATFVRFTGLSGDLLLEGEITPDNPRWRQAGIQIIGVIIPEPSTLVLSVLGVIGLCTLGRRRRRNVKA